MTSRNGAGSHEKDWQAGQPEPPEGEARPPDLDHSRSSVLEVSARRTRSEGTDTLSMSCKRCALRTIYVTNEFSFADSPSAYQDL
jgi:hypothetical protein